MSNAIAEIKCEVHGPFAEHNFPCPVCHTNPAVLEMTEGVFWPCWSCQEQGWKVTKSRKRWWQFWRSSSGR